MFREILVPISSSLTLELPAELVGKQVEILAFELHEQPTVAAAPTEEELARRVAEIQDIFKDHRVDLTNFRFDRNEANNYDE